ncbi:hypothetical protein SESBI_42193 [Sesbania bispinosa]|nr:hypothetical protein SESBI_42193 [Sesbania bispinosa]
MGFDPRINFRSEKPSRLAPSVHPSSLPPPSTLVLRRVAAITRSSSVALQPPSIRSSSRGLRSSSSCSSSNRGLRSSQQQHHAPRPREGNPRFASPWRFPLSLCFLLRHSQTELSGLWVTWARPLRCWELMGEHRLENPF